VARVPAFPGRNLRPAACAAALAAALALLAPLDTAEAFELVSVETRREGPDYLLRIEALFDAPPARLLAVLTDYDRIHELHPRMKVSRSLGPVGDDVVEVYSHFEGCVLLFCRDIHRVEHIRAEANTLVAVDVPGRGSFSEGPDGVALFRGRHRIPAALRDPLRARVPDCAPDRAGRAGALRRADDAGDHGRGRQARRPGR
jgi:hypothetical protein